MQIDSMRGPTMLTTHLSRLLPGLAVLASLLFPVAAAAQDDPNETCLMCHSDASAKSAGGQSIAVDAKVFAASVHGQMGFKCTDCHTDVSADKLPHEPKLKPASCAGCHEAAVTDYRSTAHAKARAGGNMVAATCSDCHVPKEFFPMVKAKVIAAKDVWHTILGTIDTPEKFEAHRWAMANRVWAYMEASDSSTCRSCHDFASMDLSEQDRMARSKHGRAEDEGKTCIECHKSLVHKKPRPPEGLASAAH